MMFGGGMILIWVIVIVGVYYLVHYTVNSNRNQTQSSETALSILERRYANGEIDREEFLKRKKDLSNI